MAKPASIIVEKEGKHFLFQGDKEMGAYDTKAAAESARDEMDAADSEDNQDQDVDGAADGKKAAGLFYRFIHLRESDDPTESGEMSLLASTSDPVSFGSYREVLNHSATSIDWDAARSILVNHDPDQIAGPIHSKSTDGKQLSVRCSVSDKAMLKNGRSVRDAIKDRSLRGVSIGYTYDRKDAKYDEDTRTITVDKWRFVEATLTPIPADGKAGVRSLPHWIQHAPVQRNRSMPTPAPIEPTPAPAPDIAAASEKARSDTIRTVREVTALAVEHKLDPTPYIGMDMATATRAMLKAIAERDEVKPKTPAIPARSEGGKEEADKMKEGVTAAMQWRAGFRTPELEKACTGNPYAHRGYQDMLRRAAGALGCDTRDWTKNDLAWFALGKTDMMTGSRNAANVGVGAFPGFVFLDAITKTVAMGYSMGGKSINYQPLVQKQSVPDFKNYNIGVLAAGNLIQVPEGDSLPELVKSEGIYNDALKMWGGTIDLTFQAMVSDDTNQFDRNLRQAGLIAQKTINKRVYQKLLMGTSAATGTSTWTSNTTSGTSIAITTADTGYAARTNLGVGRAALMNKTGLDSNPLGTVSSYLIVGPSQESAARGLMAVAPGQQTAFGFSLDVVVSPWLEASALTGYSTTTYYLLADPNEVTGLVVSFLQGMETPQVQQYDVGAATAIAWKIFQPFEADLVYVSVSGTNTIAAAQQCTT